MNRILIDIPQVIETPRLKLKMPCAGIGEQLHQAIMDGYEDYVRWLNWPSNPPTVTTVEEETRKHHAEFITRELIRYIIMDKQTNTIVGRCAFPNIQAHWSIPQFGISYFIRKSQRGLGYASEAANALSLLAFRFLKARKIEIHSDAENTASSSVALNLGFKLEYSQKGSWPRPDGKLAEMQTYAMFNENELPKLEIIWS